MNLLKQFGTASAAALAAGLFLGQQTAQAGLSTRIEACTADEHTVITDFRILESKKALEGESLEDYTAKYRGLMANFTRDQFIYDHDLMRAAVVKLGMQFNAENELYIMGRPIGSENGCAEGIKVEPAALNVFEAPACTADGEQTVNVMFGVGQWEEVLEEVRAAFSEAITAAVGRSGAIFGDPAESDLVPALDEEMLEVKERYDTPSFFYYFKESEPVAQGCRLER